MATTSAPARSVTRARLAGLVQGQGALVALVLLVLFGASPASWPTTPSSG
jgi:hypothetical protein